jgi:hypothetical protein
MLERSARIGETGRSTYSPSDPNNDYIIRSAFKIVISTECLAGQNYEEKVGDLVSCPYALLLEDKVRSRKPGIC